MDPLQHFRGGQCTLQVTFPAILFGKSIQHTCQVCNLPYKACGKNSVKSLHSANSVTEKKSSTTMSKSTDEN